MQSNMFLSRSDLGVKGRLACFEVSDWAKTGWIRHAFLTRKGGISPAPFRSLNLSTATGDSERNVSGNRKVVASAFHFEPKRLVLLHQKHGDRILLLKGPRPSTPRDLAYDAILTDSPDRFLGIKTADCLPILVADRAKKVVAAIHAGRQGTALQITRKAIQGMETEFGSVPTDLWIAVGPSIGCCCYEIDERVFSREWERFAVPKGEGKWMLDLAAINIDQIKKEGVPEDHIARIDLCTRCHPDLFFSYRGEGTTGRQLSFIGITESPSM